MFNRPAHVVLLLLTSFLAVSALGGGFALFMGLGTPPLALLAGTPFRSYLVPGLCLFFLVGGLSLLAVIAQIRAYSCAPHLSAAIGFSILVFEFVEILTIGSPRGIARNLQLLYFSIGISILVCLFISLLSGPSRRMPSA
jgi:hypothetical protein